MSATIVANITSHLEAKFSFRPGFSDFTEIVIEYLQGDYFMDPCRYIQMRYQFSKRQAQSVIHELEKFSAYKD